MKTQSTHFMTYRENDARVVAESAAVARKLGMSRSELLRRAVRVALPILRAVEMPGSDDSDVARVR